MNKRFSEEVRTVDVLLNHIRCSYDMHYIDEGRDSDLIDEWINMGIAETMCVGNIMKYVKRFGKKDGRNIEDLYKMLHYGIVLATLVRNDNT